MADAQNLGRSVSLIAQEWHIASVGLIISSMITISLESFAITKIDVESEMEIVAPTQRVL
jgi:hypothetical protein